MSRSDSRPPRGRSYYNHARERLRILGEIPVLKFETRNPNSEGKGAEPLDPDGNPLTSTLVDYAAITATELPSFELVAMQTPTSINPLGAKGIGEAGTIGSTPAVLNAVIDAVSHLGVRHIDMPATPEKVWAAINEARAVR